ncbi:glycosyltransferase family 4 protein [Nitrosopumilus piranensis]|uniref:Hexosyltransferase n=1 Tax=Nitrosopumilus piranensis TaxID=1582439 RepID=A0A0C5C7L8_9ARCH|nr:glycosyltransferase [Nitrosopumilus piranensis]AJM91247.1 Hexosyltransferase [Nitrosopumilus piranensis]
MTFSQKIIFVIPWYGKDATGGAEIQCKTLAEHLRDSGLDVEVYTTCSKQFQGEWKDDLKPGKYLENKIPVHRFRLDKRNKSLFDSINHKIISLQKISIQEEKDFFKNNINSKDLLNAIKKDSTSLFIFIPYLYGTTFFGYQIHPDRSVLIPCIHDEGYAKMNLVKEMLSKVRAISFNSLPEKQFASSLTKISQNKILGEGIDFIKKETSLQNFKEKYNLDKFILCAGRKDNQKNTSLLIDYFCTYLKKNNSDLKLVLTGKGTVDIPSQFSKNILDVFLTREELNNAYSSALFLCLPSINESFSRVIMESWTNKTPVLVNGKCSVTKHFCLESNGGLYFENYLEFEACLNYFLNNPNVSQNLGQNGFDYVKNNYDWKHIVQSYIEFFNELQK